MTRQQPASVLQVSDTVEVSVEKNVYQGQGLARHEGQIVFVLGGQAGDRLRVRVVSRTRDYVRAELEAVLVPGPGRRVSPCPHSAECGGCAYQELDRAAQLSTKQAIVRESLERAGVTWDGEVPIVPSPETGWRMRASLHVEGRGGGVLLGFHARGSHEVVDIGRCLQLSPTMNEALQAFRGALEGGRAWRAKVRGVDLAESRDAGRLTAAVDSTLDPRKLGALRGLADSVPGLTGLGVIAGRSGHRRYHSLKGTPFVEAEVLGLRFRSHVRSFFQANRFLVEDLAREVVALTPEGGKVLDLYAGVGLFALPLARRANRVRGVEHSPRAVRDAEANVAAAGVGNVKIVKGDVWEFLRGAGAPGDERVVLDPPRAGAGAKVVEAVARRRPLKIVYVSCDPTTLARDLKLFEKQGYSLATVRAFDMFPDTFHVETVVSLEPHSQTP